MNERIRELAEQATEVSEFLSGECCPPTPDLEKFAELIIREYAEELRQLNEGERVVLPKNREHAQALVRVGMHYLEQNK
jgi:hypothetical protein